MTLPILYDEIFETTRERVKECVKDSDKIARAVWKRVNPFKKLFLYGGSFKKFKEDFNVPFKRLGLI